MPAPGSGIGGREAVLRAKLKSWGQAGQRSRNWVVDTGASRHVCPPCAVTGKLRPTSAVVATANGTVRALGSATVSVDGMGCDVDAIVLPGARLAY